ncbi:MAG: hypothetical protein SFU25_00425 [Candidatus Caenarcaniphilales bacterium]|nr:hypothetical protein [Candidatus Caenarcaniphilales bacterium]
MQETRKKPSVDKNKIVDLWYHRRNQIKRKRLRNNLRRLALVLFSLALNGVLLFLIYHLASADPANAIVMQGLKRDNPEKVIQSMFLNTEQKAWMLKADRKLIEERIKKYNPLITAVESKVILFPSFLSLEGLFFINVKEELPWARFSNGWLLTSAGRILKETEFANFDELVYASRTLIISNENEYELWASQGKNLQKLIFSVNSQLPEMPLKAIELKKNQPVTLFFASMKVSLGYWDEGILKRAAKISSTSSVIQKYQKEATALDLSDGSRAILKLEKIKGD